MAVMSFIVRFLAGVGVGGLAWQYYIYRLYCKEAADVEDQLMSLRAQVIKTAQSKLIANRT
jgi:hypothetical protein